MHATALNYYVERSDYESYGDCRASSESDASPGCLSSSPASASASPPAGSPPNPKALYHRKSKKFRCTWKGCGFVEPTQLKIERHVRDKHLGKKARRSGDYDSCSDNEHEEEFYYTEDDDDEDDDDVDNELVKKTPSPASPPTLSHRDMARPPHEDPEYQRQIVGNFKQGRAMHNYHHLTTQQQQLPSHQQHHSSNGSHNSTSSSSSSSSTNHISSHQQQQLQSNNTSCIPTSPLAQQNYNWPTNSIVTLSNSCGGTSSSSSNNSNSCTSSKHATRATSSRPSHSTAPYPSPTYVQHHQQHHNYSSNGCNSSSNSCNSSNSSSSNNSSPIMHSNSSASNMLQQLTQQNVTVTAHHTHNSNSNINTQQQNQQQQQHISGVTITPNYQPQQHAAQHAQQHASQHVPQQLRCQQQQQQQQQQQPHHTTANSNNLLANMAAPLQHVAIQQAAAAVRQTPNSPSRRTRGENKKCRKVYGMDRRDQWCTQCKWKKACSRFGD